MRLDKFLKVSRIFKRRTIAKEVAGHDKILLNGRSAKPSSNVKEGDILEITYGNHVFTAKILTVAEFMAKDNASSMYEILSESHKE